MLSRANKWMCGADRLFQSPPLAMLLTLTNLGKEISGGTGKSSLHPTFTSGRERAVLDPGPTHLLLPSFLHHSLIHSQVSGGIGVLSVSPKPYAGQLTQPERESL